MTVLTGAPAEKRFVGGNPEPEAMPLPHGAGRCLVLSKPRVSSGPQAQVAVTCRDLAPDQNDSAMPT